MAKSPEKITIYGTHYHCRTCGAEMIPVRRAHYKLHTGVSVIHMCPKDNCIFIETEY